MEFDSASRSGTIISRTARSGTLYCVFAGSVCWEVCVGIGAVELVQFEIPGAGRRVGIREGELVRDLTAQRGELRFLVDVVDAALRSKQTLEAFLLADGKGDHCNARLGIVVAGCTGRIRTFLACAARSS